ncbi:MAG TPA: reverse transcriptase domain-containing protein, partial [Nitrosomonas sp.]|nr:reverse transcriptase domain-containing protein [Nitrosomonas sp.]
MTTDKPIFTPPYANPRNMREELSKITTKFLNEGIIQLSCSPYNSPAFLVRKKDGGFRLVVDYRKLNKFVVSDAHPLPRIDQILESLGGSKYFSVLDIFIGFHNLRIDPRDRAKTAFSTHEGHFEYVSLPMGLKNSPAIFQRLINLVFSGILGIFAFIYIDDIVVFSKTEEEHLQHLRLVFERLREAGLRAKLSKCQLFKTSIDYLGFKISTQGIEVNPEKTKVVENFPVPSTVKDLQSFLGLVNYFRFFIPNFAKTAKPFYRLLRGDVDFEWSTAQDVAFASLKQSLITAPLLSFPDFTRPFVLTTDASGNALGCVLTQKFDDGEHPISYASRLLKNAEINYSNTDRETLAVVFGIEHHRSHLWGSQFTVRTDNVPTVYRLSRGMYDSKRAANWIARLAEYTFDIIHVPGVKIAHADALSRIPNVSDIPISAMSNEEEFPEPDSAFVAYLSPLLRDSECVPEWDLEAWKRESANATPDDGCVEEAGLFYKEVEVRDNEMGRVLWVPPILRYYVLRAFHDPPIQGHCGMTRMFQNMRQRVVWRGMKRDIGAFVQECNICARFKSNRNKVPLQPYTIPNAPFDTVSADIIGPVPSSRLGSMYILAIQDQLSRWVQFVPLRDTLSETVARAFLSRWVCTYGVPRRVLTDQGSNFVSALFREFLRFLGSKPVNTCAYRPQSNGANERSHRDLHTYLAMFLNPATVDTWDTLLQEAAWVHNSLTHTALGVSPFEVLFGIPPRTVQAWLPGPLDSFVDLKTNFQHYYGV